MIQPLEITSFFLLFKPIAQAVRPSSRLVPDASNDPIAGHQAPENHNTSKFQLLQIAIN
jgi:hypothetical protein